LSGVQSIVQKGLAAAEDVFEQIDTPPEPDRGGRVIGRAQGHFKLQDVSFRYPGSEREALRHVDLEIAAGETVALVGRSGSGKSTLIQLLTRFYPADSGVLLLDDYPIDSYRLDSYRNQIALVSQNVVLFSDTVRNNIAFGSQRSANLEAVREAARKAQALEFIEALPEGFDTHLGEGGTRLSGGQRQRLAIARALLKDAPILILDEATSALDAESERGLQAALEAAVEGRTCIVIAHRPTTIERADRVIVIDAGRVVATGTHTELLAQTGVYANLYQQALAEPS
jgi:subfamily B ATP-binding cassette protein MsbA